MFSVMTAPGKRHCEPMHAYTTRTISPQHSLSQQSFSQRPRSLQKTDQIAVEISQELVHIEDVVYINL